MTLYLDTSVLVSALTNEVQTLISRAFLRETEGQLRHVSWWVEVEWNAAISQKLARSELDPAGAQRVNNAFTALQDASLITTPVEHEHFTSARDLANRAPGLRAGDALHLAIAASHQATIVTFDRGMYAAAQTLGLPAILP